MPPKSLERFRRAQDAARHGFADAMEELRTTGKQGHWIWYVFPQLAGLGSSSFSEEFGIDGLSEATKYLGDRPLFVRLSEATKVVAERLTGGLTLERLMGSRIDSLKLVSSLTLFEQAARRLTASSPDAAYSAFLAQSAAVLDVAERQRYPRCALTLARLGRSHT